MRCLKCKNEIADNVLRCNYCNAKVQVICPICGTLSPITSKCCKACNYQFVKNCPDCGATNLSTAKDCRKCGHSFVKKVDELEGENVVSEIDCSSDLVDVEKELKTFDALPRYKDLLDEPEPIESKIPEIQEESASSIIQVENSDVAQNQENTIQDRAEFEENEDVGSEEDNNEKFVGTSIDETIFDESHVQESIVDELSEENEISEDVILDNLEDIDVDEDNTLDSELEASFEDAVDQSKCKTLLINAIKNDTKRIIGISAPEGYGKTTVLKYFFSEMLKQGYAWLWGECSANSQISPFGIFQEMFLVLFNMPNFSNMSADFVRQAKQVLLESLPELSVEEVDRLFNFLYPHEKSKFEEILVNKEATFKLLEKIILAVSQHAKLIMVIDDFDMIDGSSYSFLSYFVERNNLSENIKLVISYKDSRITQGYFYCENLAENQYEDIKLSRLSLDDADNFIKLFLNGVNPLPENLFKHIYDMSKGNSAYIEQIIMLLNEYKAFYRGDDGVYKYQSTILGENLPNSIHQIMESRVKVLKKKYPIVFKTLCTAALMGNKFNIKLLEIIMKLEGDDFSKVVKMLTKYAYISQFNENISEFKNTLLWKFIYEQARQGSDFEILNERIFEVIGDFVLSSNSLKALVAQNLNKKLEALDIWTENIKLCASIGDEHLWTLSQKQCFKLAQELEPENEEIIVNNIQERLGKLLYDSKPSEAITFLSGAIANSIKVTNIPKMIELSGYLSKSCALTGNYYGVIEAVDTVLDIIDSPDYKLESALLKYKKLKAMLAIGNSEEIYNLSSNEIIPVIEQALSGVIPTNGISMDIIYESWLECNLIVAMGLIIQGNSKSFAVLDLIDEIVAKNNVENQGYLQRIKLAKALALSVKGEINKSDEVLIEFNQETSNIQVEPNVISLWNFINIFNRMLKKETTNIKEDLYEVVTFANNYNDVLIKNLSKVFLGKVLEEEGNLSNALDIFNDQVSVFAQEKIAIGALLCWYYIAKITLVTEGSDKALDIAQKALEVAKNPKINNYYFMVLYKKLIAEIYLIKGDMEAVKMYIEKALRIVKEYDLVLLKINLYQLYAKYLEEMVNKRPRNKSAYAQNAMQVYRKLVSLSKDLNIESITNTIAKDQASFKAYCQLNKIKY